MAFKIAPDAPLDSEVRRIAGEQIGRAETILTQAGDDPHDAIHDVRKRLKKLRGLLRLVRSADETFYREMNALFRDTGRSISALRDRAALIEALDKLEQRYADELATDAFERVRKVLAEKRDAVAEREGDLGQAVDSTLRALGEAGSRFEAFIVKGSSKKQADIVAAGVERTHRRARKAQARAAKRGEAEDFHELRKHVKYQWYQWRLLRPLWPEVVQPTARAAGAIGDDLGLDHDYAVFRAEAAAEPGDYGQGEHLEIVLALMSKRQDELRRESLNASRRLLAEGPTALETRVKRLYRTCRLAAAESGKVSQEADKKMLRPG